MYKCVSCTSLYNLNVGCPAYKHIREKKKQFLIRFSMSLESGFDHHFPFWHKDMHNFGISFEHMAGCVCAWQIGPWGLCSVRKIRFVSNWLIRPNFLLLSRVCFPKDKIRGLSFCWVNQYSSQKQAILCFDCRIFIWYCGLHNNLRDALHYIFQF